LQASPVKMTWSSIPLTKNSRCPLLCPLDEMAQKDPSPRTSTPLPQRRQIHPLGHIDLVVLVNTGEMITVHDEPGAPVRLILARHIHDVLRQIHNPSRMVGMQVGEEDTLEVDALSAQNRGGMGPRLESASTQHRLHQETPHTAIWPAGIRCVQPGVDQIRPILLMLDEADDDRYLNGFILDALCQLVLEVHDA